MELHMSEDPRTIMEHPALTGEPGKRVQAPEAGNRGGPNHEGPPAEDTASEPASPDGKPSPEECISSLDELAAGIAHEINNPVNGIINYAQILVNSLSGRPSDAGVASRIILEGERIAGIVQSLLTLVEEEPHEKSEYTVAGLLAACLDIVRSQLKKDGIRLALEMEPDLPHIFANGRQIRQIILNIISNSRHALNERFPEPHEEKVLQISVTKAEKETGTFVHMDFLDKGAGIPPEDLGRVLLPFFSTKSGGRGAGLGLCMSRRIIMRHHGTIHVESEPGHHTRVVIELPSLYKSSQEK
jgi:signal transduction histidine kinase